MTMKHVVEALFQVTGARTQIQLAKITGIKAECINRIQHDKQTDVKLHVFDAMQRGSGVPLERLFAWYRMPADAVLGRVSREVLGGVGE